MNKFSKNFGVYEDLTVCETSESPTFTLDSMRKGSVEKIPMSKRVTFESTRQRMKTQSNKAFSFRKINNEYFIIKRIK